MKVYKAKIEMVFDVVITKDNERLPEMAEILDGVSKSLKHLGEDKIRVLYLDPIHSSYQLPEDWSMVVPFKERVKILTELEKETK